MKIATVMLGKKKRQVRYQSEVKYDHFHLFPNLDIVKKNNNFNVEEGKEFNER